MASNPDFVQYIVDQCGGAGEITVRKMFGDYCIYCNGLVFGLISDNGFYLKPTDAVLSLLRSVDPRPPYEGAKPYYYIEDIDDHDYMAALVRATVDSLSNQPSGKKKGRH